MRIKIEASQCNHDPSPDQHSVVLDSNGNSDLAEAAVDMALNGLVAFGFDDGNIAKYAGQWAKHHHNPNAEVESEE